MRVTVCQLDNDISKLEHDWNQMVDHCKKNDSELVLLPEMPFYSWIANRPAVDPAKRLEAVKAHEKWLERIDEFEDAIVAYSEPLIVGDDFFNSAYLWTKETGHLKAHTKHFFPEEEGFYEETWFSREDGSFDSIEVRGLKFGFVLCTEIWFTEYSRKYGQKGIDFLLCPRATGRPSISQWIRCGQTSAVISGAYCLSSNRSGVGEDGFEWGGAGWICQPMDGHLLDYTSAEAPFVTFDVDMSRSKMAKSEYPLYVKD